MDDQEQSRLGGMAGDQLKRLAKKKLWGWIIAGGGSFFGWGFLIFVAMIAGMTLLAGMGQWASSLFGPSPPAIATQMSRPTEWLGVTSQAGAKYGVPNVVSMAVVEQASDGEVYGDRYYCSNGQSAGEACSVAYPGQKAVVGGRPTPAVAAAKTLGIGEGLFGLDSKSGLIPKGQSPHSVSWNVSAGSKALGKYLAATDWKNGLTAFHSAVQTPAGWQSNNNYADQIKGLVASYDSGPHFGAWALASWSSKTGQFTDPGHVPEWVFAVGSAPTGLHGSHTWKPPTVQYIRKTRTSKPKRIVIQHLLSYQNLSGPIQVWGTEKSGRNVPFTSSAVAGSAVPVWSGGVVWGGKVPLTGPNALKSITARWSNGSIDTIPWPEVGGSSGIGKVWHLMSNPQAIKKWWPNITIAAQKAGSGMPSQSQFEDAIGAVMIHESGGIPNLYANGVVGGAYGLMQLEPATAQGLPGYYVGARHNAQENLVLGGELLSELYGQTHSWHMAFAEYYYGSPPPGYQTGMAWSQVSALYNFVPAGGNAETVSAYADQMVAEMRVVAGEAPKG